MTESFRTPLLTSNTSFLGHNRTSPTGDDERMTFASAYLQHDATRVLWLIVPPVLLVAGCYGNVMTILVMRAMQGSESARCLSVYFTALAVSDLFQLWTNVLWYWPEMVLDAPLSYFHDLSCAVPFFVSYVSSMMSAWCLVVMTCQRMTSIVLPHRVDVLCTAKRGRIITGTILLTSSAASLHSFIYFYVEYTEEGYPACASRDKDMTGIFVSLYLCLASVLPFLCLVFANSVLIFGVMRSVKMSGKMAGLRGDSHTSPQSSTVSSVTTTLILTSVAFLLLTLPSSILLIYFAAIGYYAGEVDDEVANEQLALADTVCILLWMSNSAVNFYIYILSGRRFRREAKKYFFPCWKQHENPRLNVLK